MNAIQLRSLEDLHRHVQDLAGRRADDNPVVAILQDAKRITWLIMLALSFLFYHLIDRMQEALILLR